MFIGQHDMSFQDVGTECFHCVTKPIYKVFVLSIIQQKNIVEIQCQISKMNGQIEERHTVIECLTREELQLQVRHQKLITEVQDVLNQKQAMLLKFQGDKAFTGELDSCGTDPKSEFVTLNEKEHKLVSYTPHI